MKLHFGKYLFIEIELIILCGILLLQQFVITNCFFIFCQYKNSIVYALNLPSYRNSENRRWKVKKARAEIDSRYRIGTLLFLMDTYRHICIFVVSFLFIKMWFKIKIKNIHTYEYVDLRILIKIIATIFQWILLSILMLTYE